MNKQSDQITQDEDYATKKFDSHLGEIKDPQTIKIPLLEDDMAENFNFKSVMNSPLLQGIDVVQLQTFDQMYFNNFLKIKNCYRRFIQEVRLCENHTQILSQTL